MPFRWLTTEKAFVYKFIFLFLLLVLVFGFGSYYVGLGSDPYGIVHFSRHLAQGKIFSDYPVYNWIRSDWKPDEAYFVLHGNYIIRGGNLYCKYTIGFPLFLALAIRIFGPDSVYFVNIFVLLLLLWFYFKLGESIFRDRAGGKFLALLSPLLLILLIDQVWALALRPSRDLSALMFLVAGLYLGVRSLKNLPRVGYPLLILGAFCIGYSASIRLPNVLAGVPAGVYLSARLAGRVRWGKLLRVLALVALAFAAALFPAFLQNYLSSADPLQPPRPEIQGSLAAAADSPPSPLWIGFLPHTGPDTLGFFGRLYGFPLTFLILLGAAASGKSKELKYLCIGIPLIFIVFYSMWVHLMTRYMLIAQPFLILLAVAGVAKLFEARRPRWVIPIGFLLIAADLWMRREFRYEHRMKGVDLFVVSFSAAVWLLAGWGSSWRERGRMMALSLILFFLFLFKFGPGWLESRRPFQLPEAREFGSDIDRLVPEGSVIFATKPISQYIALFSSSYSLRPFEMGRIGIDSRRGFLNLIERGVPLYLLDNSGRKRDAAKALPLFKEYFDVTPVGRLWGEKYGLKAKFGKPFCTLYRIEPWKVKEVEMEIPVPPGEGERLLILNLGRLRDEEGERERLDLILNGRPLEVEIGNNINYLRVPASLLVSPVSRLKIVSDQPLPREIGFLLQDLYSDYEVELAEQLSFPDSSAADHFDEARLRDGDLVRLNWDRTGSIAIPTVEVAGTGLVGEVRLKKVQELPVPMILKVALNGKMIEEKELPPGVDWEEINFPLPPEAIASNRSGLEFSAFPRGDYRLTPAQKQWGAIFFERVKVKRYYRELELDTPEKDDYFLAFRFFPEAALGAFRVLIDGKEVAASPGGGVERLILGPGEVKAPSSNLRVVSPGRLRAALLAPDPYLQRRGEATVVDIGSEDDWAFLEDGFHGPELRSDGTPVRWTGGTARLYVPLIPRGGEKVSLVLKVVDTGPVRSGPPPEVVVDLGGKRIGSIALDRGGGDYDIPLVGETDAPGLALVTVTVPPWQPSRYYGTADKRKLGVMLDRLEVKYK